MLSYGVHERSRVDELIRYKCLQPTLLMSIIQFILPSRNKALKKLLHTYWEVCPKYDEAGKLKQEMILVVNAIRNDLVSEHI